MGNAIELINVTKKFPKPKSARFLPRFWGRKRKEAEQQCSLDNVSLEVKAGETFGLLGRNGCGKSTLIRLVSTLVEHDSGVVRVLGHELPRESHLVRRGISRVAADASFWKSMSGFENLKYYALMWGRREVEAMAEAREHLSAFEMNLDELSKPVSKLSRGTQQKLAFTRALLAKPQLLLLDEPTTGMDVAAKRAVLTTLCRLREEWGLTIILTTHDMAEAEKLCTRMAFMTKGKIVNVGTKQSLLEASNADETLEDLFIRVTGEKLEAG